MPNTTGITVTASGRTLEEMKAGIRIRMQNMVNNALDIGYDLMEAKEACRHGEWMPFLKEIGLSASTAANYMRIAKEVAADSRMAQLPYTKILALLSAPPEEREELAAAAEDMSAAEIRRLTEERNKAAEAANAESARADQAEKEAKEYYDEIAHLHTKIQSLESEVDDAYQRGQDDTVNRNREMQETIDVLRAAIDKRDEEIEEKCKIIGEHLAKNCELKVQRDKLKAQLLVAENNRVEVEKVVEVAPADYEELKRTQAELLAAAEEAERRAAEAEAALEDAQGAAEEKEEEAWKTVKIAMTRFMADCEMLPLDPQALIRNQQRIDANLRRMENWISAMRSAMARTVTTEAVVV